MGALFTWYTAAAILMTVPLPTANAVHFQYFSRNENHSLHELLKHHPYQLMLAPRNYTPVIIVVPHSLLHLDKSSGKGKIIIYINAMWEDENLKWPIHNGTDRECTVLTGGFHKRIWQPQLNVLHKQAVERRILHQAFPTVCSDGIVFLTWEMLLDFFVTGDSTDFPFDFAQVSFLVRNSDPNPNIELSSVQERMMERMPFVSVPEWHLVGRQCRVDDFPHYGTVNCTVRVSRNPRYYVVNFAIPAFLVSFVGVIALHSAVSAGSRSSHYQMALIALISLSTISLSIANSLPRSGTISRLHILYYGMVIILFSSCFVSWLTMVLQHELTTVPRRRKKRRYNVIDWVSVVVHLLFLLAIFLWFVFK